MRMDQSGPRDGDFSLYKSAFPAPLGRVGSFSIEGWVYQADRSRPVLSTQKATLLEGLPGTLCPYSLAVPQLCCITIELFALCKVSFFAAPQIWDTCWHCIGTNNHQPSIDRVESSSLCFVKFSR